MTPQALARLHARAMTIPRPWSAAEFACLLGAPGVFLSSAGQAFALGRVTADEAELLTLATDPEHRRRGLGRTALGRFEAEAVRRGATRSLLEVARSNGPAIALYEAEGYVLGGERPRYYRDAEGATVDALILVKALDPK